MAVGSLNGHHQNFPKGRRGTLIWERSGLTLLLYYRITVLPYYCITVLLYYCITLLYSNTAMELEEGRDCTGN